jgi:hypothetical protein
MTINAPLVRIVEEKYLLQRDRRRWTVETTVPRRHRVAEEVNRHPRNVGPSPQSPAASNPTRTRTAHQKTTRATGEIV